MREYLAAAVFFLISGAGQIELIRLGWQGDILI